MFKDTGWGPDVYVVREFAFGVDVGDHEILLAEEHVEFGWLAFDKAEAILMHQSNRVALGELQLSIRRQDL
ncbi:MAG: hypothetical protein CME19_04065 [Gemmatimonadetes bacterium]|nr:hypothetical protein [Gemmatimonadota bacterium]